MISSEGEEPPHFHPEFGRFMLEATPGRPWGIDFKDLLKVESNMRWRYYIDNRRLVVLANKTF
jgi:glutamate--cysteine ligase catalytic subunit